MLKGSSTVSSKTKASELSAEALQYQLDTLCARHKTSEPCVFDIDSEKNSLRCLSYVNRFFQESVIKSMDAATRQRAEDELGELAQKLNEIKQNCMQVIKKFTDQQEEQLRYIITEIALMEEKNLEVHDELKNVIDSIQKFKTLKVEMLKYLMASRTENDRRLRALNDHFIEVMGIRSRDEKTRQAEMMSPILAALDGWVVACMGMESIVRALDAPKPPTTPKEEKEVEPLKTHRIFPCMKNEIEEIINGINASYDNYQNTEEGVRQVAEHFINDLLVKIDAQKQLSLDLYTLGQKVSESETKAQNQLSNLMRMRRDYEENHRYCPKDEAAVIQMKEDYLREHAKIGVTWEKYLREAHRTV